MVSNCVGLNYLDFCIVLLKIKLAFLFFYPGLICLPRQRISSCIFKEPNDHLDRPADVLLRLVRSRPRVLPDHPERGLLHAQHRRILFSRRKIDSEQLLVGEAGSLQEDAVVCGQPGGLGFREMFATAGRRFGQSPGKAFLHSGDNVIATGRRRGAGDNGGKI